MAVSFRPKTAPAPAAGDDLRWHAGALHPATARLLPAKQRWTYVAYLRSRDALAQAAAWLDQIHDQTGTSGKAQDETAQLLLAAGRHDDAIAILRDRAAHASGGTAKVALARALLAAGQVKEAAGIARDVAESAPELQSVRQLAIEVATAQGDHGPAAAQARATLADNPNHPPSLLTLARIAIETGDLPRARAHFERALVARDGGESLPLRPASEVAAGLGDTSLAARFERDFTERSEQSKRQRDRTMLADVCAPLGAAPPADVSPPDPTDLPEGWPGERFTLDLDAPAGAGPRDARSARDGDEPPVAIPILEEDEPDVPPAVLDVLRAQFGYDALRPGQATVIAGVMAGHDTLAIMPTGAGKSLTFQIPAMLLPGVTLVLSPLIALMRDQVEGLPEGIRARTAFINSSMGLDEQRQVLAGIANGAYKLIYAAPERLRQWTFVRALAQAGTRLVVIDEAHCVSMWGHDFRPDYLQIPQTLPALGQPPVLAITATATAPMVAEIGRGLGRSLRLVQVSVFRPNLRYEAYECGNREEKVEKALEVCRQESRRGPGIVYVGSRKDAESIANTLRQRGVSAVPYHAGLDAGTRSRHQDMFMEDKVKVVVATVAFGMGVNKANVRFIVHLAPPRSLEAYAQESGRAGRDGHPARCVLLYSAFDSQNLRRQSQRDQLTIPTLRRVYLNLRGLASGRWAILNPADLLPPGSRDTDGIEIEGDTDPRVALGILEQAGLIRRHPDAPTGYGLQHGPDFEPESSGEAVRWKDAVRWTGLGARRSGTVQTAELCAECGISPSELAERIENEPDLAAREGPRLVCLELLPAGADVRGGMAAVIDRHQREAVRRVAQMMAYAAGEKCRHQAIAAHFGQRLDPCKEVCDVCDGTAHRSKPGGGKRSGKRVWTTAADALAVLEAVESLPFPMGKTGLTKLLTGSVESTVRADRSDAFGALSDVSKNKVDGLLDQLIKEGFLHRDMNHEYKLISLTRAGTTANIARLVEAGHPAPKN